MPTKFRVCGFDLLGDDGHLALTALRLLGDEGFVDDGAVVRCSHSPVFGVLSNLLDEYAEDACVFDVADVRTPGFYIELELPADTQVFGVHISDDAAGTSSVYGFDLLVWVAGGWVMGRRYEGLRRAGGGAYQTYLPAAAPVVTGVVQETFTSATAGVGVQVPWQGALGDVLLLYVAHRSSIQVPAHWMLLQSVGPFVGVNLSTTDYFSVYAKRRGGVEDDRVWVTSFGSGVLRAAVVVIDTGGARVEIEASGDLITSTYEVGFDPIPLLPAAKEGALVVAALYSVWFASGGGGWRAESGEVLEGGQFVLGAAEVPRQTRSDRIAVVAKANSLSGFLAAQSASPDGSVGGMGRITLTVKACQVVLRSHPVAVRPVCQSLAVVRGGEARPQGEMACHSLGLQTLDMECGGNGCIHGTVEQKLAGDASLPLKRRVRLHRSRDGLLVRETWSDENGNYRFDGLSTSYEYDVIAWDHEGQFRSTIANNLTPEVLS